MTEVVVTATAGNDSKSITIDFDISADHVFDGDNQLSLPATNIGGANNAGFLYTLSVSTNNAVYTTGNVAGSSTSTVHMTNTKLIASNVSAVLGGANGDAITFNWNIQNFASFNEFTHGDGCAFNLQLLSKIPTEGELAVIAYPADFSPELGDVSLVDVALVSGTTSYSHEFTGLRYGTIYSVAITTNSKTYDVTPATLYLEGPVYDATGVVPNTKPTIEVLGTGNSRVIRISSNGSSLGTTFALDSSASVNGITDLTDEIVNSTLNQYPGGNPPFTLYQYFQGFDTIGTIAELKSQVLGYAPTGGDNFLLVTENDAGASISLNGNPLGLSE
jgi:hypothetical protein